MFRSLFAAVLCVGITVSAGAAEVHEGTVSPSGKYRLGSEEVRQKTQGVEPVVVLGARVMLMDAKGRVVSQCFRPGQGYTDVPDREYARVKAYWNAGETQVAVYTGGRTWSRIDFYEVNEGRIATLPQPEWVMGLLQKHVPRFESANRLYQTFLRWDGADLCTLQLEGTAKLKDGTSDEEYVDYDLVVKVRVNMEQVEILEVTRQMVPGGQEP